MSRIILILAILTVTNLLAQEADSTQRSFDEIFQNSKRIVEQTSFEDSQKIALELEHIDIQVEVISIQTNTMYMMVLFESSREAKLNLKECLELNIFKRYSLVKELESKLVELEKEPVDGVMLNALEECSDELYKCIMDLTDVLKNHGLPEKEESTPKEERRNNWEIRRS